MGLVGSCLDRMLFDAFRGNNPRWMTLLACVGANPNARDEAGQAVLHTIENDTLSETITTLLCLGADPNARDAAGNTPLHILARRGPVASVHTLVRYRADINAMNNEGDTPLRVAVMVGNKEASDKLIYVGADQVMARISALRPPSRAQLADMPRDITQPSGMLTR
jgi:ankyrin repeat protein